MPRTLHSTAAFLATSNGDWATTNDVYRDEATVRSTWTISMTCTNVVTCAGRVTSDAGWSADIVTTNGEYDRASAIIPNWEPCVDGRTRHRASAVPLLSRRRERVHRSGFSRRSPGSTRRRGRAAACSLNDKLEIDMPFRLERARLTRHRCTAREFMRRGIVEHRTGRQVLAFMRCRGSNVLSNGRQLCSAPACASPSRCGSCSTRPGDSSRPRATSSPPRNCAPRPASRCRPSIATSPARTSCCWRSSATR